MAVRVSKKRQKCGGSVGFIDFLKEKGRFTVDFFSLGIGKKVLGKNRCIVYNKVSHFFRKGEIQEIFIWDIYNYFQMMDKEQIAYDERRERYDDPGASRAG